MVRRSENEKIRRYKNNQSVFFKKFAFGRAGLCFLVNKLLGEMLQPDSKLILDQERKFVLRSAFEVFSLKFVLRSVLKFFEVLFLKFVPKFSFEVLLLKFVLSSVLKFLKFCF